MNEIYVEHTGKTLKEIEDNLERDRFMSARKNRCNWLLTNVIMSIDMGVLRDSLLPNEQSLFYLLQELFSRSLVCRYGSCLYADMCVCGMCVCVCVHDVCVCVCEN